MGIGDETSASGGSKTVRALFQTDAQRYLTRLIHQFGGDVEGLAVQVFELMKDPQYKSAVERAVMELRGGAVRSHFIKDDASNSLTMRARVHLRGWYPLPQGLPHYQGYVQRGLDELVRGYKPRETKETKK